MLYTLDTTILGPVDVTTSQIIAMVLRAPASPAWPARTRYTDAEVLQYAESGIYWTGVFGFRTAGMVGQSMHETNYLRFTGDARFGDHNFAGIGVTGGGVTGEKFESITEGWLAFCCHMALYVWGAPSLWPKHLQQYAPYAIRLASVRWADAHIELPDGTPLGFLASVRVWRDFVNGRWAHTQSLPVGTLANNYAPNCIAKTNILLALPRGEEPDVPDDRSTMMRRLEERYPLKVRVSLAPVTNVNIPNQPATAEGRRWITVHETGNPNIGADAEMHRAYVHNGGGANADTGYEGVSFTWTVDDAEAIMMVDPTMKTWQASDGANGTGNSSESIETCVNADGDWTRTKENLARLIARRCVADANRSPDRVAQHNTWARDKKNCPTRLRANGGAEWIAVNARARFILNDIGYFGGDDMPAQEMETITLNGFTLTGGILQAWRFAGGAAANDGPGLPTSNEIRGAEAEQHGAVAIQHFERDRAEWSPGRWPDNWDVTWGRVNEELRDALTRIAELEAENARLREAA